MVELKTLQHKQNVKSKKRTFVRQEAHRYKRLSQSWRKPKGVHSKLRLRRRGKPTMVSVGFKMPESVRGLTKDGSKQVFVSSPNDLKNVKSGEVVILRKVSKQTRLLVLNEAKKLNINVTNFKFIDKRIAELQTKLTHKKTARIAKKERKAKKDEEEKKKAKMSKKAKELADKKKKADKDTKKQSKLESKILTENKKEEKVAETKAEKVEEKKPKVKAEKTETVKLEKIATDKEEKKPEVKEKENKTSPAKNKDNLVVKEEKKPVAKKEDK